MRSIPAALAALALGLGPALTATAQDGAAPGDGLLVELNHLEVLPEDDGCLISFVTRNGLQTEITDLEIDLVLFDEAERVDGRLILNIGRLPVGKTRVHQYVLAEAPDCAVSQILVNDVVSCTVGTMTSAQCLDALRVTDKTEIPLLM